MDTQKEIRLSGSGGQGLILAGIILAEGAILDGNNAVQSQSYGPEARGGASKAEVIISNDKINYPEVIKCDVLLSLTQVACDKYVAGLKSGGILIVDSSVKKPEREDIEIYKVPIINMAKEKVGSSIVANIIALGVLNKVTNVVTMESLKKAILNRVPASTKELNEKAFNIGKSLIE